VLTEDPSSLMTNSPATVTSRSRRPRARGSLRAGGPSRSAREPRQPV